MTNVMRIPDKFEPVDIISGIDFEIDTKGLCCEVCPRGGSIMVMLPGQNGRILVKEDEKFDFCGKIIYRHASGNVSVNCFYYHTL